MERVRNQFKDAVDQEMQRRDQAVQLAETIEQGFQRARVQARRETIARNIAGNRARKHAEIQAYVDDMRSRERLMSPVIRQLDEIDIESRLEEINQGIWNNRGEVSTQQIVDERYRKYIIGKKYILSAHVPTVSKTNTEILKNGSQYSRGKVYQGERPAFLDNSSNRVGFRTRYDTDEDIHTLTVLVSSDTNKNMGQLRVFDESTKRPTGNSKNHLTTTLGLIPFDLQQAEELIQNGLIQSSIHRTDHSISGLYEQGLRDQEWLRRKGGSGYEEVEYTDPKQAPLSWRVQAKGRMFIDRLRGNK